MLTIPPVPTGTVTRTVEISPIATCTVAVPPKVVPVGYALRYVPAPLGRTPEMFRVTAPTPVAGTPPTPVTLRSRRPFGASRQAVGPDRVSSRRAAGTGTAVMLTGIAAVKAAGAAGVGHVSDPVNQDVFLLAPFQLKLKWMWSRWHVVTYDAPSFAQSVLTPLTVSVCGSHPAVGL